MNRLLSWVDALSDVLAWSAMTFLLVLIGDMMFEVVSRRGFGAPTLWAYDIAYMLNGTIFLLAAGYTLKTNEHIRIDFLSMRLSRKAQDWINVAVYLCLLFPTLAFVCQGAVVEGWSAFVSGELEPSSPWQPVVWPFYAGIAVGFSAFWLQAAAQCVRHARSALGLGPSPLGARAQDA